MVKRHQLSIISTIREKHLNVPIQIINCIYLINRCVTRKINCSWNKEKKKSL